MDWIAAVSNTDGRFDSGTTEMAESDRDDTVAEAGAD